MQNNYNRILFLIENSKKSNKKRQDDDDTESEYIKKRHDESDKAFERRVNRITRESVQEAKFEAKYGVKVVRNPKTGEIRVQKKPKDQLAQTVEIQVKGKKGNKTVVAPIQLTSAEKKKIAKEMLAKKRASKEEPNNEFKREEIKFGEVVHEPPRLTVPRFAQKAATVPRVSN